MQSIFWLVLVLFLFVKFINIFLEFLNYKHLVGSPETIPKGFENSLDAEKIRKIKAYTSEKSKFSVFNQIYSSLLMLIFVFSGFLSVYNQYILDLKLPFILSGILFFILLFVVYTILEIPFDLYQTFKIEKTYGFNTMTIRIWVTDLIKTLVVSAIIFSILISCVLFVVSYFASTWWLFCWILFFVFTIFLMYISPYVLEPLFNKFTPVDNEELINDLKDTMGKAGINVTKVLKMDASKRTKHSNAYFSGIGHVKRIVLYDTILAQMDNSEIVSVIAHEAGHWKKKHILKNIVLFEVISFVFFFAAYLLFSSPYLLQIFGVGYTDTVSHLFYIPVSLFLLYFIFGIVMFPVSPVMHILSRKYEREADAFAVKLVKSPRNLISALIKLSSDNLSNLYPHPIYEFFHYSHPSILKRLKFLKSLGNGDVN